jgi:rod shape determining protein RodA
MIRTWRDYNFFLVGCVFVLLGFSLAMVYSATLRDPLLEGYFSRHLVNLAVGIGAMLLFTAIDYHVWQSWTVPLYILTVTLLAVVLVVGMISSGAQSWLDLGLRTLQPSEPSKLLLVIVLAAYWQRMEQSAGTWRVLFGSLVLLGLPLGLVFIQPDFGTSMVLVVMWLAMAWVAGTRLWQLLALFAVALPVAYYGWNYVLDDYQKLRLLIFLDPLKYDPKLQNGAWNIIQSLNAVSAGGLTGRGWTLGTVSQVYLPVRYTDFIFAVTAEELGFVGATVLLIFLGILIWQAVAVAQVARDTFGRLIAVGVAAMFLCHILVNVGMNMSIMPITGIPLPFVSYGGSFSLTTMAAVGLLESVALRRHRMTF